MKGLALVLSAAILGLSCTVDPEPPTVPEDPYEPDPPPETTNQAPVAHDLQLSVTALECVRFDLPYTDPDGPGPYLFTLLSYPVSGYLVHPDARTGTGGSFAPGAGDSVRTDTATWKVSDGLQDSNMATIRFSISPGRPRVLAVGCAENGCRVAVAFSGALYAPTAENTANYRIDNGILVSNASLTGGGYLVELATSRHADGVTYGLAVSNVTRLTAPSNTSLAAAGMFAYLYTEPLLVTGISRPGYASGILAVNEPLYTDAGSRFSSVATYAGETYLLTASTDREAVGDTFLEFNVSKPARVYVAYDHGIPAVPAWLSAWTLSSNQIASTSGNTYDLYWKEFPVGTVGLGGNAAGPTNAMYSVIVVGLYEVSTPICAIAFPPGDHFATIQHDVLVAGTAWDNVGVTRVSWSNAATGLSGEALGTTAWVAPVVLLREGANVITVRVQDAADNVGVDTMTVTVVLQ